MIDAEKAAAIAEPVFAAQDWTWYTGRPSREGLIRAIESLLESVNESPHDTTTSETGRLLAVKTNYDDCPEVKICLILGDEIPGDDLDD